MALSVIVRNGLTFAGMSLVGEIDKKQAGEPVIVGFSLSCTQVFCKIIAAWIAQQFDSSPWRTRNF
jgi:hypothetical protein